MGPERLGVLAASGMDEVILSMANQTDPDVCPLVADLARQVHGLTSADR